MKITELLVELSFQGHTCTKDCSGHAAGYKYAIQHKMDAPTETPSRSFDSGTGIAADQIKNNKIVRPKVRDPKGRFTYNPQPRGLAQQTRKF